MAKIITVFGATGTQGGGVVRRLKEIPEYHIRAVTRNVEGEKALALKEAGVEVVYGDLDNVESLKKAIAGAYAVFGIANFWDYVFAIGPEAARKKEAAQGVNLATVCAESPTLQHYVWSGVPSAYDLTNGQTSLPHGEGKTDAIKHIRSRLPSLASKTTELWVGFYTSNLAFIPPLVPTFFPPANQHIWLLPTSEKTKFPLSGDVGHNVGKFVEAVLKKPDLTRGKIAVAVAENIPCSEIIELWSKATGKPAIVVDCSPETYERLYPMGGMGKDLAIQFGLHAKYPEWMFPQGVLRQEELGIHDLRGSFETFQDLAQTAWK